MQLLRGTTAPSPEFVTLSPLVKPEAKDELPASSSEPMVLVSPLATLSSHAVNDALRELQTYLTLVLKLASGNGEEKVATELIQSDEILQESIQIFRPIGVNGLGLFYRLIPCDSPSAPALLALALHQSNTTGGKVEPAKLFGVLICVGVAGLALAQCGPSLQYSLSQRINDGLGILARAGTSDIPASKAMLLSFLLLEDESKKTNLMIEAKSSMILPDLEDGGKGVMSPMRLARRSGGRSGEKGTASTDLIIPMSQENSAEISRSMIDRLTLLSVAEIGTHIRRYESSGQERKANLDLTGGAKARFRRRKGEGRDADLDNFDFKGPSRELKKKTSLRSNVLDKDSEHGSLSGRPPKQIQSSRKDTKTKGPSVPAISAPRSDGTGKTGKRSNNNRLQFDDESDMFKSSGSVVFDGASTVASVNRVQVNIALNEDLSCSYKDSQLASCTVEGIIQVQIKGNFRSVFPFHLLLRDNSSQIGSLQENKRFAEDTSHELQRDDEQDYADKKFTIKVPKADNYFPVLRYKCSPDLRPVPIRVQTRVKSDAGTCRVALQISSNPNNSASLTDLTIVMNVPDLVVGESLMTQPAGGVWDNAKSCVIWCVSELGGGEKFQLQARFDTVNERVSREALHFPVMVRCQCLFAQLSDIELEVRDIPEIFPAEMTMKVARRFRLSHREKS